jgi:hypothetical protein
MAEYKIVTFGCWNEVPIKSEDKKEKYIIPFEYVLKYIKTNEAKYDELIVLGDNYYPKKINKIKIYNEIEMNTGFDALKTITKPKYVILGNHDVENTLNRDNTQNECSVLENQMKRNKIKEFELMAPYKQRIIDVGKTKYNLLFIDTSVYDEPEYPCYNLLKTTKNTLREAQNKFIIEKLNNEIDNVIFFGHEPLVSIKTKSEEKSFNGIREKTSIITELSKIIFDNIRTKKITYVCADVHMYQSSKITFGDKEILQIVCGTGGAEKDYYCSFKHIYEESGYKLELLNYMDSYGFVELTLKESGLSFMYNKIIDDEIIDDEKKKILTMKPYEQKYLIKYKNNILKN